LTSLFSFQFRFDLTFLFFSLTSLCLVKVGGMRITQHKIKDNNEKCEVKSENHDDDEVTSSSPPKEKPQNLVICGSVTRVR